MIFLRLFKKFNNYFIFSFQLTADMVPNVYLASHQLRVETIFKACSNYLGEQLTADTCLSMFFDSIQYNFH